MGWDVQRRECDVMRWPSVYNWITFSYQLGSFVQTSLLYPGSLYQLWILLLYFLDWRVLEKRPYMSSDIISLSTCSVHALLSTWFPEACLSFLVYIWCQLYYLSERERKKNRFIPRRRFRSHPVLQDVPDAGSDLIVHHGTSYISSINLSLSRLAMSQYLVFYNPI
jgi:hypothetical protein